jgi:hypothetical protein
MNIPKKLKIKTKVYTVRLSPKIHGASFDMCKQLIIIGSNRDKKHQIATLFHEIFEILCCEYTARYQLDYHNCNCDYLFNFDHETYTLIMDDFADCIMQL